MVDPAFRPSSASSVSVRAFAEEEHPLPRGGLLRLAAYEVGDRRVTLLRCRGFAPAEMVGKVLTHRESVTRLGRTVLFHDLYELDGYDPMVRDELTRWQRRHGLLVEGTHVLLRSRIVAMGIQVASLALGQAMRTYSLAHDFEREIRKIVPGFVLQR
jgi:hypothetical protein